MNKYHLYLYFTHIYICICIYAPSLTGDCWWTASRLLAEIFISINQQNKPWIIRTETCPMCRYVQYNLSSAVQSSSDKQPRNIQLAFWVCLHFLVTQKDEKKTPSPLIVDRENYLILEKRFSSQYADIINFFVTVPTVPVLTNNNINFYRSFSNKKEKARFFFQEYHFALTFLGAFCY
jgi:hypothetical protein